MYTTMWSVSLTIVIFCLSFTPQNTTPTAYIHYTTTLQITMPNIIDLFEVSTVKPLYSGHPWDVANWLLYIGGQIIKCTFNREVLFGTLLGGCFREVTFLYRFAIWLL